ncbi:MAG: DNA polymerase III subunit beta [Thermoanaerobaculia bacterium]|nr:DNA polymerase III subunit beta [Thermoanaerobaculia bacterium]
MEIRLRRDDLLAELTLLQGIVERRSTIPILSHLLVDAREDALHLAATDLDVSLATQCPADIQAEGAIAVEAKKFTDIIRALGDSEIHLTRDPDSHQIHIAAGRSRFRIRGLEADNFPTLPEVETGPAADLGVPLMKGLISKIFFAISSEESRFQLNGALFKVREGGLEMVATDGHRLALVEIDAPEEGNDEGAPSFRVHVPQDGVLIPRKALQEILRFDDAEESLSFRRSEHHLSFRFGRRELTCRILEGTFPDYDRVIARDQDKRPILERDQFQEAVQRVALLTGERSRGVLLAFEEGELTISATNPDVGEAVESVPCEYDDDPVKVGLNPDYLSQFLGAAESPRVRLELKDGESQCVGYPEGGEEEIRYLCVIMPMHV